MPTTVVTASEDGLERRWRPRRLFSWKTYDARNFDEWSSAKERSNMRSVRLRPVARQLLWGPGAPVRDFYDTYEHALTLGVVSERGLCMHCGASRPAPRCRCEGHETKDESLGMLRWVEVDKARRRPRDSDSRGLSESLVLPETDDTPGVVLDPGSAA